MESELTRAAISLRSDSQMDSVSTSTVSQLETSTALPVVQLETHSTESIYKIINSTITQTAAPNMTSQKTKKPPQMVMGMGMQLDTWILVVLALAFIVIAIILLALFVAHCRRRARPVRPAAMELVSVEGGAQEGSESSGASSPSSLESVLKMMEEEGEVEQEDLEYLRWKTAKAQRADEQLSMLVLFDNTDCEEMYAESGF